MSRSPEEIKAWHDKYYDCEISRVQSDLETWLHDFGSDAIFRVSFWDRDEKKWSTYCAEYMIWQTVELPNKEILVGWRPVEEDGMFNSVEYRLLSECQIMYYPPEREEEEGDDDE